MYLLFECGICSSLYQVQVEKFSNSLQKVVCPSCQSFHYFGTTQDVKEAGEPTIEKVFSQNSKLPALDPKFEQRPIHQEIFWRCGVCESSYHFNLDRVTSQGIKVTCTTCFSFFVLQKVGVMVDLDHMVMHEVSSDKPLPSTLPPEELSVPPMIDINEVSGKFNLQSIQEALAEAEAKEATVKTEIKPQPAFSKPESFKIPSPPVITPSVPSQPTTGKVNPYITSPISRSSQSTTSPGASSTQPGAKLSDQKPEIKDLDKAWVNSFKSYNAQRKEFKYSPVEVSTEFVEHSPKRKPNVIEQYMIQISVWIAGVSIFSLLIVFGWEWYEGRKAKNAPPPEVTAPVEQAPANPNKPQYGFPVLED